MSNAPITTAESGVEVDRALFRFTVFLMVYVLSYGPFMGFWTNHVRQGIAAGPYRYNDLVLSFYAPINGICFLIGYEDWLFDYLWWWIDLFWYPKGGQTGTIEG